MQNLVLKTEPFLVDYSLLHKTGDESLEVALSAFVLSAISSVSSISSICSLKDDLRNSHSPYVLVLNITSVFMVCGSEFKSMKKRVKKWAKENKNKFGKIKIDFSKPVLCGRTRIEQFALLLEENYHFLDNDVLVCHGKKNSLNLEYFRLLKTLEKKTGKKLDIFFFAGLGCKMFSKKVEIWLKSNAKFESISNAKSNEGKIEKNKIVKSEIEKRKKIRFVPIFIMEGYHLKKFYENLKNLGLTDYERCDVLGKQDWFMEFLKKSERDDSF